MSNYLNKRMNHILANRPLPKKKLYRIPPKSEKRKQKEAEQKASGALDENYQFFVSQRSRMTGRCLFCNQKSERDNDETFFFSIAHLFPKRDIKRGGFPSIKHHPENWIELCHTGNDCHHSFDTGYISWETLRDSAEWIVIRPKLIILLEAIAQPERKHKLYSRLMELITKS